MQHIKFKPVLATLLCVAVMCAVAPSLWAQAKQVVIQGKVTDQTGGALPGVEVVATETATGITTAGVTTDIGNYRLPVIKTGIYRVEAGLPGFKTFISTNVEANVGQILRLDIEMEVGDITETIEVIGESGVTEVQKDTNELSTVISEDIIDRIPVASRKIIEVVVVAPAVTYRYTDIQPRDGYTPWFSVAGSGPGNHIWKFDGANAHHMRVGGAQVIKSVAPPDVMKQVRVVTNNYSAEFGGGDGALFIMESKSGTNDFHGSLYYYGRNDAVDARPFFATGDIPPLRKHVYGGYLGGPIIKDKAHFLISLEKEKLVEGREWIVTVPTALEKAGDFSQTFDSDGSLRVIYDPATAVQAADGTWSRTPFAGNVIPAARFDPITKRVMDMYPAPNIPGVALTNANNFGTSVPDITLTRFWQMYRFDYKIGDNDSLYWRTALEPLDNIIHGPFGRLLDSKSQDNRTEEDNHVFGWDRVWSPTMTSSFRQSFMIFRSPRHMAYWRSNWAGQLGLKNLRDDAFPRFDVAEYREIGQGWYHQHPDIKGQRGASLEGSLVFLRGNHTLKTGTEFMHSRAVWASRAWPSGRSSYTRNGTWNPADNTGGRGGASFLLGYVHSARMEEGPVTDMRGIWISGFFQDDWRIHPDVTLNLGIRYEYDQPKVDVGENHNLFDPDKINPVCNCPGNIEFSSVLFATTKIHTAFYNKEPYRFAPRFGFAWTPGGRQDLVIRGGGGIFYVAPDQGDGFWGTPRLGRSIDGLWQTVDNGLTSPFQLSTGFPQVPLEPLVDGYGAVPIDVDTDGDGIPNIEPRLAVSWFNPHRATKYRQLYNFSVQKRMGDLVAEIGYLGNIARHMPTGISLNQVHPSDYAAIAANPKVKQSLVPFPQFHNVSIQGDSRLNQVYHAGLLLLRGRIGRDLNFQTNYTIARHLGDNAGYRGIYRIRDSYGPQGLEVRHRWVMSGVWELPFGLGKDFLNEGSAAGILGGWSVGFIMNAQSRSSGSVGAARNKFDTGGVNQRPDRVSLDLGIQGGGGFDPGVSRWFDSSAFALVPDGELRLGDAGLGIIHNPYRTSFDFSVFKAFQAAEDIAAELRLDLFNSMNNTNWNGPNTSIGGTSTGIISSSERARVLEFSMRIIW